MTKPSKLLDDGSMEFTFSMPGNHWRALLKFAEPFPKKPDPHITRYSGVWVEQHDNRQIAFSTNGVVLLAHVLGYHRSDLTGSFLIRTDDLTSALKVSKAKGEFISAVCRVYPARERGAIEGQRQTVALFDENGQQYNHAPIDFDIRKPAIERLLINTQHAISKAGFQDSTLPANYAQAQWLNDCPVFDPEQYVLFEQAAADILGKRKKDGYPRTTITVPVYPGPQPSTPRSRKDEKNGHKIRTNGATVVSIGGADEWLGLLMPMRYSAGENAEAQMATIDLLLTGKSPEPGAIESDDGQPDEENDSPGIEETIETPVYDVDGADML